MDDCLGAAYSGAAGSFFAGFLGPRMGAPADAMAKQAKEAGKTLQAYKIFTST